MPYLPYQQAQITVYLLLRMVWQQERLSGIWAFDKYQGLEVYVGYVSFYFGNRYIFSTSITINIWLISNIGSLFLGNNGVLYLLCDNIVALNNYLTLLRGSSGADIVGVISEHCWLLRHDPITIIVVQIDNAINVRWSWCWLL